MRDRNELFTQEIYIAFLHMYTSRVQVPTLVSILEKENDKEQYKICSY